MKNIKSTDCWFICWLMFLVVWHLIGIVVFDWLTDSEE